MDTINGAVEIEEGIYWVGLNDKSSGLQCNPYLIVDGDEAVLIDPGSVLDFSEVLKNVSEIVSLDKIKYVVLHHQDPDFCSSVPLFEKEGGDFSIVTHWRTQALVKYYGIKSQYYIVDSNEYKLVLKSGRTLRFLSTPYLHFAGAIVTYDEKSKILFSSDLFGAFSYEWSLFADKRYLGQMKTFHEQYMPSNDILRPVMEIFMRMNISQIAPQHGSIIKENVKTYIECLRDLECGVFLNPVRKNFIEDGGYTALFNRVLTRLSEVFSMEETLEIIKGLEINFDINSMQIIDYKYIGSDLWEILFETIFSKKGIRWLTIIEPLVRTLAKTYNLNVPKIFVAQLLLEEENILNLNAQNEDLKASLNKLKKKVSETEEKVLRCPVTGLYNDIFFKQFLKSECSRFSDFNDSENPFLIIINVDNMMKIRSTYSDLEVDETLKTVAYILNSIRQENHLIFRLPGAYFGYYLTNHTNDEVIQIAEGIRNTIANSDAFIEKITITAGVAGLYEIDQSIQTTKDKDDIWYELAITRIDIAKRKGMNIVCSNSKQDEFEVDLGKILIIDNDTANTDILNTVLENANYKVFVCTDGECAIQIIEKENPNLIISEIMIPKINGFLIREAMLASSQKKNIPFFICSHVKNEDTIQRAISLGIDHYFKKPYMLSELIGIVKNKTKGETV